MSEQSAFLSNTSIIHSYPFINDGPKLQEPLTEHNCYTRHVPPGVLHIKPSWKPVKLDEKPPFSYATMIAHAILSSEHRRLTLSEIYQWISEQYPCYHITDHRWQNSIRHNLSLQKAFVKLDRNSSTPSGKGCFWTILPGYEQQFIDNLVKRGISGTNASIKQQQQDNKQFKKVVDSKKPTSHLFTIFRMNPTSNGIQKKMKKKRACRVKYTQQNYDSDCDSGVDLGCIEEPMSAKDYYSTSLLEDTTATATATATAAATATATTTTTTTTTTSVMPQDLFIDDNTPSSIIQQSLFDDWPQTQYQPLDYYFDTSSFSYLLYNDFLSSQNFVNT